MAKADYALKDESLQPEAFVVELNKDLTGIEDAICKYLDEEKVRYVFSGLDQLMCSIMIRTLPLIAHRRITRDGVLQITRNLYALQQNLTNIVKSSGSCFDRARSYFELINMSLEDQEQFRHENPKKFSQTEYEAITKAYRANNAADM
eukprot:jgi/Bigna1/125322/aug1.1_g30